MNLDERVAQLETQLAELTRRHNDLVGQIQTLVRQAVGSAAASPNNPARAQAIRARAARLAQLRATQPPQGR